MNNPYFRKRLNMKELMKSKPGEGEALPWSPCWRARRGAPFHPHASKGSPSPSPSCHHHWHLHCSGFRDHNFLSFLRINDRHCHFNKVMKKPLSSLDYNCHLSNSNWSWPCHSHCHCQPLFSRNPNRRGKTQFPRRKVLVPITMQVKVGTTLSNAG